MIRIALSGRLGKDPLPRETKSGKPMTTGFMLTDIEDRDDENASFPAAIVAFGRHADVLSRHSKGSFLSVAGRLQQSTYEGKTNYSIVVDAIVSAEAVRPSGGRRKAEDSASQPVDDDFADRDIPF
ncbi:MAG: single-stranded DNA-binding protein [Cyanobacteria bacterium P01_F01_bin.3]